MKMLFKISLILYLLLLISCNKENDNIQGLYNLGPGLFGKIVHINENNALQLFSYSDLGGIWYRFDGTYQVVNYMVILNIIRPESDSTYSIQIDTLYIRESDDLEFLVPSRVVKEFDESINTKPEKWYYHTKVNQNPFKGVDCYLKVGKELTVDLLTDNNIVCNFVNKQIMRFVGYWWIPPPVRPIISDSLDIEDLDSLVNDVNIKSF